MLGVFSKSALTSIQAFVILVPLIMCFLGGNALHAPIDRESKSPFLNPLKLFAALLPPTTRKTTCTDGSGITGRCTNLLACTASGGNSISGVCTAPDICCSSLVRCGGTVRANNSILVNDGYPGAYPGGNCVYRLEKLSSDICQMRVDMENLVLAPPSDENSKCVTDTFTFVKAGGNNPPVICGDNTGQHMYLHMFKGPGSASINIAAQAGSTDVDRTWRLRVSQFKCDSEYKAPASCLQYFTSHSGTINSFNFKEEYGPHQIGELSYLACIEQKAGFCSITYSSDAFGMSGNASETSLPEPMSGDMNCTTDFLRVTVKDKSDNFGPGRYCGTGFDPITTFFDPFQVTVVTDDKEDSTVDGDNRGFSLKYNQLPC